MSFKWLACLVEKGTSAATQPFYADKPIVFPIRKNLSLRHVPQNNPSGQDKHVFTLKLRRPQSKLCARDD